MVDQPLIRCRGIKKTYEYDGNRVEALKSTDLDIQGGQLTLVAGPSGSGKTTLISIIATILSSDAGQLTLLGQEMGQLSADEKAHFRCANIGIVYQSLFLIPTLTVLENVMLPLTIAGYHVGQAKEKASKLLQQVHLDDRSHVSPASLSKGQQQRVAISRAMINDASIIICDEPTSALDHVTGFEIMEFLHGLAQHSARAVIVVTHDPRVFPYADRIINMSDGEIT